MPKNDVAKWAGIITATFSISQAFTGFLWGRAADRWGRKPTILLAAFSALISCLLFGFSQNLPWAIVARAMAGGTNGNVGTFRTVVAEMIPEKELQARAFSLMPLVFTIGSIFGPGLGGALADPVARYPSLFGNSTFLKRFPYALPNIAAASFLLIGLVTGFLFLKVRYPCSPCLPICTTSVLKVMRNLWKLKNMNGTVVERWVNSWWGPLCGQGQRY